MLSRNNRLLSVPVNAGQRHCFLYCSFYCIVSRIITAAVRDVAANGENQEAVLEIFIFDVDEFNDHGRPYKPSGVVCEHQII
jgi:hypothetical protein